VDVTFLTYMENERNKMFVRRVQGKGHGHKWEGNIKMDLREIGYEEMKWIQLA
jgi:hypothetical protein